MGHRHDGSWTRQSFTGTRAVDEVWWGAPCWCHFRILPYKIGFRYKGGNDGLLEKPDTHQLTQVIKVTLTTGEAGWHCSLEWCSENSPASCLRNFCPKGRASVNSQKEKSDRKLTQQNERPVLVKTVKGMNDRERLRRGSSRPKEAAEKQCVFLDCSRTRKQKDILGIIGEIWMGSED